MYDGEPGKTLRFAQTTVRTKNLYLLVAAIVVTALTFALAALIVVFVPNDPNTAAVPAKHQVVEPKLESMADSNRRTK